MPKLEAQIVGNIGLNYVSYRLSEFAFMKFVHLAYCLGEHVLLPFPRQLAIEKGYLGFLRQSG